MSLLTDALDDLLLTDEERTRRALQSPAANAAAHAVDLRARAMQGIAATAPAQPQPGSLEYARQNQATPIKAAMDAAVAPKSTNEAYADYMRRTNPNPGTPTWGEIKKMPQEEIDARYKANRNPGSVTLTAVDTRSPLAQEHLKEIAAKRQAQEDLADPNLSPEDRKAYQDRIKLADQRSTDLKTAIAAPPRYLPGGSATAPEGDGQPLPVDYVLKLQDRNTLSQLDVSRAAAGLLSRQQEDSKNAGPSDNGAGTPMAAPVNTGRQRFTADLPAMEKIAAGGDYNAVREVVTNLNPYKYALDNEYSHADLKRIMNIRAGVMSGRIEPIAGYKAIVQRLKPYLSDTVEVDKEGQRQESLKAKALKDEQNLKIKAADTTVRYIEKDYDAAQKEFTAKQARATSLQKAADAAEVTRQRYMSAPWKANGNTRTYSVTTPDGKLLEYDWGDYERVKGEAIEAYEKAIAAKDAAWKDAEAAKAKVDPIKVRLDQATNDHRARLGMKPVMDGQDAPPAPAVEQRHVGAVYSNGKGQKAEWTGQGWKVVQ